MIKVIEEILRTETDHMTEVEAGIEIREEDSIGLEETAYLGTEVDPDLGIKVKREGVITVENLDILYVSVRKRKGIKANKRDKKHKCNK